MLPQIKYEQSRNRVKIFKAINEMLQGIEFYSTLEIACGLGYSAQHLRQIMTGKHFEASDIDFNQIEQAKQRNPKMRIMNESVYNLKRQNNSFDLIVALEVLEHLTEPNKALEEIHRVTSKYCLLSVPREPLWRIGNLCYLRHLKTLGNTPKHLQHWSKNSFVKLVSKYFEIIQIKNPLPSTIILGKKLT